MTTATLERLRPADVRQNAHQQRTHHSGNLVRVNTPERIDKWAKRQSFFTDWYDPWRDAAGIKNDSEVARRAGMSHSSISSWRGGRQRPTAQSLADVAAVLGRPAPEAWEAAGIKVVTGKASLEVGFGATAAGTVIEPSAEDRAAIARIRASKLSKPLQDRLIKEHLDAAREAREAQLRQLQRQIAMLESGQ
jgi:transcriptional regulator with XRE-family HTH domain